MSTPEKRCEDSRTPKALRAKSMHRLILFREAFGVRRIPASLLEPDYAVALASPAPNWIPWAKGSSVEKLIVFVWRRM